MKQSPCLLHNPCYGLAKSFACCSLLRMKRTQNSEKAKHVAKNSEVQRCTCFLLKLAGSSGSPQVCRETNGCLRRAPLLLNQRLQPPHQNEHPSHIDMHRLPFQTDVSFLGEPQNSGFPLVSLQTPHKKGVPSKKDAPK